MFTRLRMNVERSADGLGRQRIDLRCGKPHRLDPETRLYPVDAQLEEPGEMPCIARRPRRSHHDQLLARIDALAAQDGGAPAEATLLQIGDKTVDAIAEHLFDISEKPRHEFQS